MIATTLRIKDSQYRQLKDIKAEYREATSEPVSINTIICIAIKEFLEHDPLTTIAENEVY